jgi:teichuronic acid exporter
VFAGFAAVAEDVIRLTIGSKWDPAIPALQLLCIAMPLRLIGSLASPTVMAIGRPDVSLRYVLWAAICVPVGILVGVQWGMIGVAAAWAICYPIAFLGGSWHLSHALGCPFRMVLTPIIPPILSAMTMVVVVRGANQVLFRNSGLPLRLALSVCVGIIVYSGTLRVVSRAHFVEAWQLALSLVAKRTLKRAYL